MNCFIKHEEFCIINEEFSIKKEELCIHNDEFCRWAVRHDRECPPGLRLHVSASFIVGRPKSHGASPWDPLWLLCVPLCQSSSAKNAKNGRKSSSFRPYLGLFLVKTTTSSLSGYHSRGLALQLVGWNWQWSIPVRTNQAWPADPNTCSQNHAVSTSTHYPHTRATTYIYPPQLQPDFHEFTILQNSSFWIQNSTF